LNLVFTDLPPRFSSKANLFETELVVNSRLPFESLGYEARCSTRCFFASLPAGEAAAYLIGVNDSDVLNVWKAQCFLGLRL